MHRLSELFTIRAGNGFSLRRSPVEAPRGSELRQLRRLLQGDGLRFAFQPVIELATGRWIGVEALARFDPRGLRPPLGWFQRAAHFGVLEELEVGAFRAALAHLRFLPDGAFLSINISPTTLTSGALIETVAPLADERVVIEITEHAPVQDYDALKESLTRLRRRGVRVAIDDAGAGFASLQHIVRLGPDLIKLDMTLTRGIEADLVRRALATALISFAREIGVAIIAEGIETEDEFRTLRALGVPYGQGFFLGEPGSSVVPPAAVADGSLWRIAELA